MRLAQQLRVSRPVRLCKSALVEVPTVIGWLQPVILFPVSAVTGLPAMQLEAILAHELAHIRRHDYLVNLLQHLVETLLFYHPAVWWVSHHLSQERELCCDDLTVNVCGDRVAYAQALAALEELRGTAPDLALAAGGGSLLRRIRRLLGVPVESHRPVWWLAGTIVLATIAAVVMTTHKPLFAAISYSGPTIQSLQLSPYDSAFEFRLVVNAIEVSPFDELPDPDSRDAYAPKLRVLKGALLNGSDVESARVREPVLHERTEIVVTLTDKGVTKLVHLAEQYPRRRLAVVFNGKPLSVLRLDERFFRKELVVGGHVAKQEAEAAVAVLNARARRLNASMPLRPKPAAEATPDATNGFTLPATNLISTAADPIIGDGRTVRGYLGLFFEPLYAEVARELNLFGQNGALVMKVMPETPAEQAGLKPGDVITEFDGKKVADARHLHQIVLQTAPNTKTTIKVIRNGKETPFTITLGELASEQLASAGHSQTGPLGENESTAIPNRREELLQRQSLPDTNVAFTSKHLQPLYPRIFHVNTATFVRGLQSISANVQRGSTNVPDVNKKDTDLLLDRMLSDRSNWIDDSLSQIPPLSPGTIGLPPALISEARPGGIQFLIATNTMSGLSDLLRQYLHTAGVDLSPPKTVFFNEHNGIIYVRATSQDLDLIEKAIQALNIAPPQVRIEVKWVQINDSDPKTLGFDWWLGNILFNHGSSGVHASTAPAFTGKTVASVTGILTEPQFQVAIKALEQGVGVRLLAAPKVTTLSGQEARIKVVDIKTYVAFLDTGTNTIEGEPLPILDVTPRVLADGHTIQMNIRASWPEFLEYKEDIWAVGADKENTLPPPKPIAPLPKFRLRPVAKIVTLRDGQTVVLGGLISEDVQKIKDKVPVLGDLPLLGRLFRSESGSKNKNVIIFVTPTMVDPAGNPVHSARDLPVPQNSQPPQRR